jgi:translation initiation factor IF-3
MSFEEAFSQAKAMKKDVVLRNARTEPPVVKITNYRKDLMRKLFTKLGENKAKP